MVDDANIIIALIVDKDWYAFIEFIEGIWALSKIRGSDYKVLLLNKSPYRIPWSENILCLIVVELDN